jgi:hypothetical protein
MGAPTRELLAESGPERLDALTLPEFAGQRRST